MLTACFFELCTFSTQALRKSIRTGSVDNVAGLNGDLSGHGGFDLLLPKACEALVLVTQCLASAMLEIEENRIGKNSKDGLSPLIRGAVSPHGQDIAVCAIGKSPIKLHMTAWLDWDKYTTEFLRLLDVFLPRVIFGKPIRSSEPVQSIPGTTDSTGFSYVKRDLVRLLGILCHKDRKIQDSIRNCEGITVIMNLCVVDERNPCASPNLPFESTFWNNAMIRSA